MGEKPAAEKRLDFLAWLLKQQDKPYIWGGKGPDEFDCSGLVTAGLFLCGITTKDWRQTHAASTLFDSLDATEKPRPGDLAFYGNPVKVSHVMVCFGDGRVYGATGGHHSTISIERAKYANACVKFRSAVSYRPDFRGYRKLPIDDEMEVIPNA